MPTKSLSRRVAPKASGKVEHPLFPVRRMIGIGIFATAAIAVGLSLNLSWQASLLFALLACMGSASLTLLMGTAGQFSIANAGLLAVGAFSSVWFMSIGVPFPADVLLAVAAAGLVGLIVGIPALRLRGLYLAIATLAAHFIIYFVVHQYQNEAAGPAGFVLDPVIPGNLAQSQDTWFVIIIVVLAAILVLVGALMSGRTGRTWRMIRDHEEVVPVFGINATRWKLGAFVISSMILGLQGSLLAHFSGLVSSENFHLNVAIIYLAMVVVGGLGSLPGAVIGALLISLLPDLVPALVRVIAPAGSSPVLGANISTIIYGLLILVFVIYAPKGLAGLAKKVASAISRHRTSRAAATTPTTGA